MKPPLCAFVHAPEMDALRYPPDCPFKPERAGRTRAMLASFGLLGGSGRREVSPSPAPREELELFHTAEYLTELERAAAGDLTVEGLHHGLGTPDTPVFPDMVRYGAWACGATLTAANLLLSGDAHVAFNPSGGLHHAGPDRAGGFCYLNDVVLGCLRLAGDGKRVLFLDIDAHHSDGVQDAFYERNDVMVISLHESGKTLYPGRGFEDEIGAGPGTGFTVNVPLPVETFDEAYLRAFDRVVLPLLSAYDPDVLVLEIGMDTLKGDPLVHLGLTNNAHADVIRRLRATGKPLLATGGGGYHVENTVRGWALAWKTLCGEDEDHDMSLGLGGVMLASSEWEHGLRDRVLPVQPEQRQRVEEELERTLRAVTANVFPHHGLSDS